MSKNETAVKRKAKASKPAKQKTNPIPEKPTTIVEDKETIRNGLIDKALEEIDLFTKMAEDYQIPTGLLLMLFGKLVKYDEYEDGIHRCEGIIENLVKFFLNPEHSAAFNKEKNIYVNSHELSVFLMQILWVFQKMQAEMPLAFFDRYSLDRMGENELKRVQLKYAAKNEIAKNANVTTLRYEQLINQIPETKKY